jgi:hypothetical protein
VFFFSVIKGTRRIKLCLWTNFRTIDIEDWFIMGQLHSIKSYKSSIFLHHKPMLLLTFNYSQLWSKAKISSTLVSLKIYININTALNAYPKLPVGKFVVHYVHMSTVFITSTKIRISSSLKNS